MGEGGLIHDITPRKSEKGPLSSHSELENDVEFGSAHYEPGPGEMRKKQVRLLYFSPIHG